MDADSFIVHVKTFTKILQKMLKQDVDTSNYEMGRCLWEKINK